MKHLLVIILALLSATAGVAARDTEVSLSYGVAPAMSHLSAFNGHWNGMSNCWGTVNATIDHRFAENLWIGLNYTFSTAGSDHAVADRYGKLTWHGLMCNIRYEWYTAPRWRLYSHIGVGVLVEYFDPSWEDSYNRTNWAFQASPIGIEGDLCRNVALFAEFGYGMQGVGKAGIRIGF